MALSVEEIIANLGDSDKPLVNAQLAELTNASTSQRGPFDEVWPTVEVERRRQIAGRLVEMAENNFELDFESLYKAMLKDEDATVRMKAVDGLYESENVMLIEPVVGLLEHDPSVDVQASAAMTLGKFAIMGELNKIRQSHVTRIRQTLLGILNDKSRDVEVRRRALEAISAFANPEVTELIKEAYKSGDHHFKLSAIYAMGKNCQSVWLPILLKELSNPDPEIRYEAAVACGELEDELAAPYLVAMVNDTDTEVRLAVIQALGKIGGDEAKACLTRLQHSASKGVRQMAEQALEELETYEALLSFGD